MAGIGSFRCGMHENGFKIDLKYFYGLYITIYLYFLEYT